MEQNVMRKFDILGNRINLSISVISNSIVLILQILVN